MTLPRTPALLLLLAVGLLACNGKSDDSAGSDTDGGTTGETTPAESGSVDGACPQETHAGRFVVDQTPDYAFADGQLLDGVVPTNVRTEVFAEGGCRILRRENPFCDPACGGDETCDLTGACVPYPTSLDVGSVTVRGLSTAVSMDPVAPANTYFDTALDNPPWTPGDALSLAASGGDLAAFEMHGFAPDTLTGTAETWTLVPGQPLEVSWTPPTKDVGTEVVLELRIDLHGTTPSGLECVFDDTGSATVSAATLDVLIDAGLTGFPAAELRRRTADHADLDNGTCVDFLARSVQVPQVDIEGYTPCRTDAECPDGQECNEELERCE